MTLILTPLIASGCGESEQLRFFQLPSVQDAQAYVIRFGSALEAHNIGEVFDAPLGVGGEIELAIYTQSLNELHLTSGPIDGSAGCERDCVALSPEAVFVADATDETPSWSPRIVLSDPVQDVLVRDHELRCGACPSFEREFLPLPAQRNINVNFVATAPTGAYLGLSSGEVFRVGLDETVEPVCARGVQGGLERLQHGVYRDDRLWLVGLDRIGFVDLSTQNPAEPCVISSTTSPPSLDFQPGPDCGSMPTEQDCFSTSAISGDDEPFEIILVSHEGRIFRYDESGWSISGQVSLADDFRAYVTRLGPSLAVATAGSAELGIIEPTTFRTRALSQPRVHIRGLARWSERSVMIGTDSEGLVLLDERGILQPVPTESTLSRFAVMPYLNGVLSTIEGGGFTYHDREVGACPDELIGFSSERVYTIGALDETRVIFGDVITYDLNRDSAVGLIRPQRSICDVP